MSSCVHNKCLVSIVIPCHNAEQWVGEAVESALEQSWENIEVVVIDDSSEDNSIEIVKSYGDRVQLLQGDWHNGNAARNAGMDAAKGEWIQFLDADDCLRPDKIQCQLEARVPNVDVLYSPIIVRDHNKAEDVVQKPVRGSDFVEQWLRWELCQTGAALWRADSLQKIGGWKKNLPCCQDNEITLRALMRGLQFQYVDSPGAIYRIWSDETVCRKNPMKVIWQKTALIDECLVWLNETNAVNANHMDIAGQACFEMARTMARYSIKDATAYHHERKNLSLMIPSGSAAPTSYRLLYRFLGFSMTERIARFLRK